VGWMSHASGRASSSISSSGVASHVAPLSSDRSTNARHCIFFFCESRGSTLAPHRMAPSRSTSGLSFTQPRPPTSPATSGCGCAQVWKASSECVAYVDHWKISLPTLKCR